jgi:hypothetical protein
VDHGAGPIPGETGAETEPKSCKHPDHGYSKGEVAIYSSEVTMLPPFIIEQIRKREERQREDARPVLELPLERPDHRRPEHPLGPFVSPSPDSEPERGIIVVDL